MDSNEFFETRIKKAKGFGFPDPIYINTEKLTDKNRVLYIVEIEAIHIPDKDKAKTHHFSLKFSKFKKIKEDPYWTEDDSIIKNGFTIADKESLEKLVAYIKANQSLLKIDILSKDYTEIILSNNKVKINLLGKLLKSFKEEEQNIVFDILKKEFPLLDKKFITYKLVKSREESLIEFEKSLPDADKIERNYWQPFLEKNKWMLGLSFFIVKEEMLKDGRIDLHNNADFLLKNEDGFVDVLEIKHPNIEFWKTKRDGSYDLYRGFLQPSDELRGSISQARNYIFQLEKEVSNHEWIVDKKCVPIKPSCTIIIGRSKSWKELEKTEFRLLNDSLHGIKIITFDHLLNRAENLLNIIREEDIVQK